MNSYSTHGTDSEPRTALITGGTQGLGRAMAEALGGRGVRVAITGRQAERAEGVAREIDPSGEQVAGFGLDICNRESFTAVVDRVEAELGGLDILVNNAGMTKPANVWEIGEEEWDEVLTVNLRSVLVGCQIAAPRMRARGWGRIVNHASLAGQQGGAVAGAHYAASKAGIIVLTKILAADLAADGVTVNAISPAAVWAGPMEGMSDEQVRALEQKIPVGRVGAAHEVAALVAFLTSEDAGYVTGATYDINGGLFMR